MVETKLTKEEVIELVTNILEANTYLKKQEDGSFEGDIEVDYRDELGKDSIKKIVQSDNPMDTFYELFETFDAEDCEWQYCFKLVKEKWDNDLINLNDCEDIIIEWMNENLHFNFPYDHYLKQDVKVNIIVDTGDGNYDYTLNNWLTWDAREEEINDESSILWLVQQQGYTRDQLENLIREHETCGSKFLKSVYQECENVTTHMNALAFFTKMTLKEFIELQENPYDLTLSEKTSCGLYDCWNGAGGVLEIHLERPVTIPKEFIEAHIDGCRGYGVDEIYGVSSSFWE